MAFPTGWGRKCSVTIDNTKVSGSANHSDFPVLLTEDNLPSEMFDADGSYPANSDGGDIRFTSDEAGTTELAREVVEFTRDNDPANGTAQIWVKVPTLDYNDDTVIYVFYNNSGASEPAADSTYGSEAVWSGYDGVWHLEEDPSGSSPQMIDSSANDNDGTSSGSMSSGDSISAKISNGLDFDGSNDLITTSDTAIGNGYTSLFMSVWVKSSDTSGYLVAKNNGSIDNLQVYISGGNVIAKIRNTSTSYNLTVGTTASIMDGNWKKIDVLWSGSTFSVFLNGSFVTSASVSGTMTTYTEPLEFAGRGSDNDQYMAGVLDEIRIAEKSVSSDWIATEYANQNAPDTFSEAGTPEDVDGVTNTSNFFQLF